MVSVAVGLMISCQTTQSVTQPRQVTILKPKILPPSIYDAAFEEIKKQSPDIKKVEKAETQVKSAEVVSPVISGKETQTGHSQGKVTNSKGQTFIWPVTGTITSKFGKRWGRLHSGIDVAAPRNTRVNASAGGKVLAARRMKGYGWTVILGHKDSTRTLYAHLNRIHVKVGQFVSQGRTIGRVGRTGRATGYHLHFEIRMEDGTPHNPISFLPRVNEEAGISYSKKILSKLKSGSHNKNPKTY